MKMNLYFLTIEQNKVIKIPEHIKEHTTNHFLKSVMKTHSSINIKLRNPGKFWNQTFSSVPLKSMPTEENICMIKMYLSPEAKNKVLTLCSQNKIAKCILSNEICLIDI